MTVKRMKPIMHVMDNDDDLLAAALQESLELYDSAQKLASLQVKAEMEALFASESPESHVPSRISPEAMLSFWVEMGLSEHAAERLLAEINSSGRSYSTEVCSAKVQRWQRILPDADIGSLIVKDVGLLEADVNQALFNMIILVDNFPGRDLVSLISRQPRLLWCEDLKMRLKRVMEQLTELHPSRDISVVREMCFENPELLYRMDYYPRSKYSIMDELPIEIQNMFLGQHADQGIGYMLRYYANKKSGAMDGADDGTGGLQRWNGFN